MVQELAYGRRNLGQTSLPDQTAGLSHAIWGDCPRDQLLGGGGADLGWMFFDGFENMALASTSANTGKYASFSENSGVIAQRATVAGGENEVTTGATDNNSSAITLGGNAGACGKILSTAPKKLWFEARFAPKAISDEGYVIGIGEEGLAANDTILPDGAAALTAKDFIGFRALSGAPSVLSAVHALSGGAEVIVVNSALVAVASAFRKVGLKFEANEDGTGKMYWYVDGTRVAAPGVKANATNFPDGEELVPIIYAKTGEGSGKTFYHTWWAMAQLF